jgi:arsenite methyltransferase
MQKNETNEQVSDYYGKELQKTEDLKTNACCTLERPPELIMKALNNVHDEVQAKYYGCGLTIPTDLSGCNILDLGSGSGRDCYIAAQLVGESGSVVGVDMTDEQLAVANEHLDYHHDKFGFKNTKFLKGNIEELDKLELENNSFDIIISNCVINLATDKEKVLRDSYNLLKEGGEMYFSDVYSDRRVPAELVSDPVLYGECLSGALYWNDFLEISKKVGFIDPRSVESKPITINNPELEKKVGDIKFYSVTYRLYKVEGLEYDCEDYGHAVRYKGNLLESPASFVLDDHHEFKKGQVEKVCGNSYLMLNKTRYNKYFDFMGDFSTHHGIFEGCGASMPFDDQAENACVPTAKPTSCC